MGETTVDLADDQAIVWMTVLRSTDEFETAPRRAVLGRRTRNELLVVAPGVSIDGSFSFSGRWALVHVPTGMPVSMADGPARCHEIADAVSDLDWSVVTSPRNIPREFRDAVGERLSRLGGVDPLADDYEPTAADRWAETRAGAPVPRGAVALAAWTFENVQDGFARTMDPKHEHAVPSYLPGTESKARPRGEPNPLWTAWVIRNADQWAIGYLLLVLRRVNQPVSEQAAAFVASMWEAGDGIGEWSWDLARSIDKGEVDTFELPGAPPPPGPLLSAPLVQPS